MAKAKSHPGQIAFAFDAPIMAAGDCALAGLELQICGAVGTILNSDPRSRHVIAAEMSVLLGDDEVSKAMLDAYSSPARAEHKVIMSRFLALVAVTGRHDVLDRLLRPIGAAVLVGDEVHTARIGQIDAQIQRLNDERKRLKTTAPLIRGGNIT